MLRNETASVRAGVLDPPSKRYRPLPRYGNGCDALERGGYFGGNARARAPV